MDVHEARNTEEISAAPDRLDALDPSPSADSEDASNEPVSDAATVQIKRAPLLITGAICLAILMAAVLLIPRIYGILFAQHSVFELPQHTDDSYHTLLSQADVDMMHGIVNILVVGIDYAEERDGKQKDFNSDVMLVLAMNFNNNTVHMISAPRDSYSSIPGHEGYYKLNASLHLGGGIPNGLSTVCRSVSWVLGGVPIDYYIAVDMPTVKRLVDDLGGVDYEMDITFTMNGRSYTPGPLHMDGQACLDYFRARKGIDNDIGRSGRQKKLLMTIYRTLRNEKGLLEMPDLIKSYIGGLYTNMSLEQISAAAVFAYKLSDEDITMHTMEGTFKSVYNSKFLLLDQDARVKLIKNVYGINAKQQTRYGARYATWEWADMLATDWSNKVEVALAKYASKLTPEQYAELNELIRQTRGAVNAQRGVSEGKKNASAIDSAKNLLQSRALTLLEPLGAKFSWYFDPNE